MHSDPQESSFSTSQRLLSHPHFIQRICRYIPIKGDFVKPILLSHINKGWDETLWHYQMIHHIFWNNNNDGKNSEQSLEDSRIHLVKKMLNNSKYGNFLPCYGRISMDGFFAAVPPSHNKNDNDNDDMVTDHNFDSARNWIVALKTQYFSEHLVKMIVNLISAATYDPATSPQQFDLALNLLTHLKNNNLLTTSPRSSSSPHLTLFPLHRSTNRFMFVNPQIKPMNACQEIVVTQYHPSFTTLDKCESFLKLFEFLVEETVQYTFDEIERNVKSSSSSGNTKVPIRVAHRTMASPSSTSETSSSSALTWFLENSESDNNNYTGRGEKKISRSKVIGHVLGGRYYDESKSRLEATSRDGSISDDGLLALAALNGRTGIVKFLLDKYHQYTTENSLHSSLRFKLYRSLDVYDGSNKKDSKRTVFPGFNILLLQLLASASAPRLDWGEQSCSLSSKSFDSSVPQKLTKFTSTLICSLYSGACWNRFSVDHTANARTSLQSFLNKYWGGTLLV